MTGAEAVVLAHHPVVEALPAVVPMVVLVGAFAGIVVADRRGSRRAGADTAAPSAEEPSDQAR